MTTMFLPVTVSINISTSALHFQGGMIDHVYTNFEANSGVITLPHTDHILTLSVLPQRIIVIGK